MTDEQIQISKDSELMTQVISLIASYAIENDMSPNETIKTVAKNMLSLLKIATFENWERKPLPPATPTFPEDATNGNIMTTMFPDIKIREHEKTDICDAYIQIDIWDFSIYVSKDWWNAPYKEDSK